MLVTENIHAVGWDTLRKEADAVAWPGQEKQPLLEAVKDVQAILVRVAKIDAGGDPGGRTAESRREARGRVRQHQYSCGDGAQA
ncbi:MAG: hypothetical protein MZW92_13125 [Comamonadaceae bacterium]|nr:hypothetical protein [Comamonadaceae bacterium]